MKNNLKLSLQDMIIILLSVGSLIAYALLYSRLPEAIPSHWNAAGEIDDTMNKANYSLLILLPIGIYLMMKVLPLIDPKRKAYQIHAKAYQVILLATYIMMSLFAWLGVLTAMGMRFDVSRIALFSIGILFIVMGNFMPQIRQNYFFGIKTPWTLASEVVWKKTHRVGGYTFTIAGILAICLGFLWRSGFVFMVIGIMGLAGLFPVIYAYWLYRKLEK